MVKSYGFAADNESGKYSGRAYDIREPEDDELLIEVEYCGICHSDIHTCRGEWGKVQYPIVTGHEMIGRVVQSKHLDEWPIGSLCGVGCMVDSCRECHECKEHWENHCPKQVGTYNSQDKKGEWTSGGYGKYVLVNKNFGIHLPANLKEEEYRDAAPLLCAGITTFSPINQHNMKRGNLKIGILGVGGLGHMAIQYAAKINETNQVYALSRSDKKRDLAIKLGAKGLIAVGKARRNLETREWVDCSEELKKHFGTFDYLIDTISSADKQLDVFVGLLRPRGQLIMVGLPPSKERICLPAASVVTGNKGIIGSCIGGIKETQEMLDFSFKHKIMPMVEHVKADQITESQKRVVNGDVQFRFVIDVKESYKNL